MIKKFFHYYKRPLIAALVGAITPLAFAPFKLWLIAIISPTILFILLINQSAKQSFAIGYSWGFALFTTGISWIYVSIDDFGGMPIFFNLLIMGGLIAFLALYYGLFALLYKKLFPQLNLIVAIFAMPSLWLIADWLRGYIFTGFPWLWLGYSQINSPLASFAPLAGVELVTLVIIMVAAIVAYIYHHTKFIFTLLPISLLLIALALQNHEWVTTEPAKITSVALVQGNIEQKVKWLPSQKWPTLNKYLDLTDENWDADLIIWPEAAIPAFESELPFFLAQLDEIAYLQNSTILTGIIHNSPNGNYYNSILPLGKHNYGPYHFTEDNRYHKHHLLPFGEFVPFEKWLRNLAPFFNLPMSSFTSGSFIQPNLLVNDRYIVAALCYEIIFNEQVRRNITDDTDFILTLSNDAWFGKSIGPKQHMEISQMRALETGIPVLRVTNNGVTAITDHKGQIVKMIEPFTTDVLTADILPTTGSTPYLKWGSYPLYLWIFISLAIAIFYSRKQKDKLCSQNS